ncbi:DNA-3-methyladenine glycosylase 2 family protein [Ornithinimicrobium ciconiae]|uniref:DNA-3-methyladenine glycosylase II n=1 Tax=Ornithinimicrobium ciconiae TaxID=2594265 RepID=A0A516GE64_9MICO|nr:AlkA N-terminal domain-containing protein [Ornithinimicrobium ciconiae]QDO89795.1 DNA-3-methyladenine glycosylase 2 family protein [Ornithinimicrobium ciconiae]
MTRRELPAVGGLEAQTTLTTLVNHATPGSEEVSPAGTYRRLLDLAGTPTVITLRIGPAGIDVEAPATVIEEATALVRWWFDLETNPAPVGAHLAADPLLARLVRQRPALRPVRHPAGFEAAIHTVLGQQVTLSAGRLFAERLCTAYSPGEVAGLRLFPTAAALVAAPSEELRAAVGLTTARARTVQALAAVFADGFSLDPGSDPPTARARLLEVPGIGPWTVEYLALRVLGDPDAFPASDAVVRRALAGAPARAAQQAAESWRPYRAWATAHLWASQTSHLRTVPGALGAT